MSTYTFDARSQHRALLIRELIASKGFVMFLGLTAITCGSIWGMYFTQGDAEPIVESAGFILLSVFGAQVLAYTYAITSLASYIPKKTPRDLVKHRGSIAEAGIYEVIKLLGAYDIDVSPENLKSFINALLEHNAVEDVLRRLEIDGKAAREHIQNMVVPNITASSLANLVITYAVGRQRRDIDVLDIFAPFLLHSEMRTFLRRHNIQEKDIWFVIWWEQNRRIFLAIQRHWWTKEKLLSFSGIGLSWAAGYTPFIDQFARVPQGNIWDEPYGHDSEVEQLINSLARRNQSNVLLVGQPGSGRFGVVKELIRRIKNHKAHPALHNKRAVYIHIGQLISIGRSTSEQLSVVSRALQEMERAGNIIAILDGMGTILGEAGEGRANLTDVLLPFFSSPSLRVVVMMSSDEYHMRIRTNQELVNLFEVVQVEPLSEDATLEMLALVTPGQERKTGIYIPYRALREIVENTATVLPYIPFPEKAFDLLEEAIVQIQGRKERVVTAEQIHTLLSQKVGIDIGRVTSEEQGKLLSLDDLLHRRVVNQEAGITAITQSMIRARAGVRNVRRPIGTFLFLGPTGVGKTETAKALAEVFFGSEDYLVRLDMTEFQGTQGVEKLIGGNEYGTGRLTSIIADHPFCVLLLDEYEKADDLVKQLFLPVFDEGFITDARGQKYVFNHTIIIATSNAGAEYIRTNIGEKGEIPQDFSANLREHILSQGIFKPEVLNRFDGVITFTPLSEEHIKQVAGLMLKKLNKRLDAEHGITVNVTDDLLNYLMEIGYDSEFGARPMARAIQNTVEYAVAQHIIRGSAQPGEALSLSVASLRAQGGVK